MREHRKSKIFLTGATGFIGREVLRQVQDAGFQIMGTSRSKAGRKYLAQHSVEIFRGELTDIETLSAAMSGCDAIVNLAYDVRSDGPSNVAAYRGLLQAAKSADIRKIIHMSSIVVYDDWPSGVIDPSQPVTMGGTGYRRAKIEMENMAMAQDIPVVLLEPTLVYGAESSLWTQRFVSALASGGVVLPEDAGHAALVHVRDVAQAVVCALGSDVATSAKYPLNGPEPIQWFDYLGALSELTDHTKLTQRPAHELRERLGPRPFQGQTVGRPSAAARISALGRRMIGHSQFEAIVKLASGLKRRNSAPFYPDHGLLDLYLARPEISIDAAASHLGWEPKISFSEAMREISESIAKNPEKS